MTKERAIVLALGNRYLVPGFDYPITPLEIQNLIYFLTEARVIKAAQRLC